MFLPRRLEQGFTLIEMVAVIVLLGVIGAGAIQYISLSVGIYNDSARRDNLSQMGRYAVERVAREIHNALPGSVRVERGAGSQCLEFMPVTAASSYLGRVSDAPGVSSVTGVEFGYTHSAGDRIAIYTIDDKDVYVPGSKAMADIDSVAAGASDQQIITLDLPGSSRHRFPNESPMRRFYIANQRISFCVDGSGQLMRYQGYSASGFNQPLPPASGGVLLAENLQTTDGGAVSVFNYTPGTLQRAGIVHLDFRFRDDVVTDEWLRFSQEVSVRNVP